MKLELKHLAPYLPYKLQCQLKGNFPIKESVDNNINTREELTALNIDLILSWATRKPILHPLYDLRGFMPNSKIKYVEKIGGDFARLYGTTPLLLTDSHYHELSVYEYEKLLEYHFDVFDLISKGLAVDINTLD